MIEKCFYKKKRETANKGDKKKKKKIQSELCN